MESLEQDDQWQRNVAGASRYAALSWEQKRTWYSKIAVAYHETRPRYPKAFIDRAIAIAQLSHSATILEIGCGPGIATVPLAQLGFSMVCLEPSQEACQLAQQHCATYPNVDIKNITFEEWETEPERFDAVLAATSFHWVSQEVGYSKAAATLKTHGSLILLWNTAPQPSSEVCQQLSQVYQAHAPSLGGYEPIKTQEETLRKFGHKAVGSGYFNQMVSEQMECDRTYSLDEYLALLNTLSPYIALEPQIQAALFADLRTTLEKISGELIHTSYLSVFQVAHKAG